MNPRKHYLLISWILVLLMVSCSEEPKTPHTDSARPHFLIIMADDVGRECFDAYGESEYETPNITRLAEEGKIFHYAYSQPLCTPSRVEIMTGMSNYYNYDYFEILPRSEKTFGDLAKEHGYVTCVGGKWQLTGVSIPDSLVGTGTMPEEAGFDEHYLYQLHSKPERYWGATYHFNGEEVNLWDHQFGPEVIVDEMVDFMERHYDQPMLIYYPMILAHAPFVKTPLNESTSELSPKERYMGMVKYMDALVGRLVKKTDDLGIRENTLIIFTTDNGTPKRFTSRFDGKEIAGGKGQTIDPGIHAPFVVNWKNTISSGEDSSSIVALYDIYPTLADILGDTLTDPRMGTSLWPQLKSSNEAHRPHMLGYFFPTRNAPREDDKEVIFVQNKSWKLYQDGRLIFKPKDPREEQPILPGDDTDRSRIIRDSLKSIMENYLQID
ncbi:MAG: sulfatase-like hydrolase/transferase [Saprospiraceae bacterium]|nr:sulfatase-like hydrolase/transferase [Saprospiraceae bacterium]